MPEYLLETIDLRKTYVLGEIRVKALRGVNLQIEEGEVIAIMGPSGHGKTTLLNMLGGLDVPTSGKIFIDGIDISKLSDNELARFRCEKMGYVFQSYNLIQTLTAKENVILPMSYLGKLSKHEMEKRAVELLETFGLGDYINHKPAELSGGQQQRVAFARAFANEPAIIFGDEPTGALDSKTSKEVLALIRELNEEKNQTFILVTHDPAVGKACDRVVYIKDGRIFEGNPFEEEE